MLRPENVATPADAGATTCDLPERRALMTPGSLLIARSTSPAKRVAPRPAQSSAVTCTGGLMMLSFMASAGCTVNASLGEPDPGGGAWLPPGGVFKSLREGHPATS